MLKTASCQKRPSPNARETYIECAGGDATDFRRGTHTTQVDKQGAKALAKVLKTNTSLKVLNLDGNDIEIEGAVALAEALGSNKSLTELSLAGEWPRIVVALF